MAAAAAIDTMLEAVVAVSIVLLLLLQCLVVAEVWLLLYIYR